MMMISPPTPLSTLTRPTHSQCSLRAQSLTTNHETGQTLEHGQLRRHPKYKATWE
jgi:hypothetical protein